MLDAQSRDEMYPFRQLREEQEMAHVRTYSQGASIRYTAVDNKHFFHHQHAVVLDRQLEALCLALCNEAVSSVKMAAGCKAWDVRFWLGWHERGPPFLFM